MKEAIEILTALLIRLGVEKTKLAPFEGTDIEAMKKVEVEDLAVEVYEAQKTILENDSVWVEENQSKIAAAVLGGRENELGRLLKSVGVEITKAEKEKLPKEKYFDSYMALGIEKLNAKKKADPSNDVELQKEIERVSGILAEREEEIRKLNEEVIPNKDAEFETKWKQKELSAKSKSVLEAKKELLISKTPAYLKTMEAEFDQSFDIDVDDKGEITVLVKGKKVKALTNGKPKSIDEAWTEVLTKNEAFKKQEGKPDKPTVRVTGQTQDDDKKVVPPHLKKAQEDNARRKAELEANK
jgi:hypothetical protein